MCRIASPSLFRKADGTYGLVAGASNDSDQIFLSDSDDLITFYNDRTVTLNNKGIKVKNPVAEYDKETDSYNIQWEGDDGNSYLSVTEDYVSFSEPVMCDHEKIKVTGELPVYAKAESGVNVRPDYWAPEIHMIGGKYRILVQGTVDENGNVLLVYHARDWSESYATGNDKYGLGDTGRHAYVKCVHFGADGFPILNMTSEQILYNNHGIG